MKFLGSTFDPTLDQSRLETQLERVFFFMKSGEWHTLREINDFAHGSEAGTSARLRDIRRMGYQIDRRRKGNPELGIFEYRLSESQYKFGQDRQMSFA